MSQQTDRTIRIFLSSTFKDMEAEREYLRTNVFPRLQAEAARRDVTLLYLDLRWGITDEESRSGKVLEVCLKEIENSRPFFIGMVGDRYGWCPTTEELDKNENLRERYQWVEKDIADGLSITEMEMQFGVLRMSDRVFASFYIKKGEQSCDPKLENLKRAIRDNNSHPVYDYLSPEEIGKQVYADFMALLENQFPVGQQSLLEKERLAQKAYIRNLSSFFVKEPEYFKCLDRWYDSESNFMAVTGEAGIGKSAVAANWIGSKEEKEKNICHFIGKSGEDNSKSDIIGHLCREIEDLYGLRDESTADNQDNYSEKRLNELFSEISGKDRLLILLDGIDRLDGNDNAKMLNWLPDPPENIHILCTTSESDQTMDALKLRGSAVMEVKALSREHRIDLVNDLLWKKYRKHLDPELTEIIVDDSECRNTLVLHSLVEELANFGNHDLLRERVRYYIGSTSIPEFFGRVLSRYEYDYSIERVRSILALIAFSRRGMSEQEIMDIAGLTTLHWSEFYCAFAPYLILKNGHVNFADNNILSAVSGRYSNFENETRGLIIEYFKARRSRRAYLELPWQYYKLKDHKSLHDYLFDIDILDNILGSDRTMFVRYWEFLLSVPSPRYSFDDYLKIPKEETYRYGAIMNAIGYTAATYFGNIGSALKYYSTAQEYFASCPDANKGDLATCYNNIGTLYHEEGNYQKALDCYYNALDTDISVYGNNHPKVASLYNNIGSLYNELNMFPEVLDYFTAALETRMEALGEKHPEVAKSYNNLAALYSDMGENDKALQLFEKAMGIFMHHYGPNHPEVARIINNISHVNYKEGKTKKALEGFRKALQLCKEYYGTQHPMIADCCTNIGLAYEDMSESGQALKYYNKALTIYKSTYGDHSPATARCYECLASVYYDTDNSRKAIDLYKKSLKIYRGVYGEQHSSTANTYYNLGMAYDDTGQYGKAIDNLNKALDLFIEIYGEDHPQVAACCENIEEILRQNRR